MNLFRLLAADPNISPDFRRQFQLPAGQGVGDRGSERWSEVMADELDSQRDDERRDDCGDEE